MQHLHPDSVYQEIVKHYRAIMGINADVHGFCGHALRATTATNALAHNADIAKVQEWLGHGIATTRLYDRRQSRRRRVRHLRWSINGLRENTRREWGVLKAGLCQVG